MDHDGDMLFPGDGTTVFSRGCLRVGSRPQSTRSIDAASGLVVVRDAVWADVDEDDLASRA